MRYGFTSPAKRIVVDADHVQLRIQLSGQRYSMCWFDAGEFIIGKFMNWRKESVMTNPTFEEWRRLRVSMLAVVVVLSRLVVAAEAVPATQVTFSKDIAPIFQAKC